MQIFTKREKLVEISFIMVNPNPSHLFCHLLHFRAMIGVETEDVLFRQ